MIATSNLSVGGVSSTVRLAVAVSLVSLRPWYAISVVALLTCRITRWTSSCSKTVSAFATVNFCLRVHHA